jgi:hypothetical protein
LSPGTATLARKNPKTKSINPTPPRATLGKSRPRQQPRQKPQFEKCGLAAGDPIGYEFTPNVGQGTRHVIYTSVDHHLIELKWVADYLS